MAAVPGFPFDLSVSLQSIVNILAILAVALAVGRLVQNVATLTKLIEKVDERLIGHMLDRTIHPNVATLEADVRKAQHTAEDALRHR